MRRKPRSNQLTADDRAYRAAQLVQDRIIAGAPADDPVTREALELLNREFGSRVNVDTARPRR